MPHSLDKDLKELEAMASNLTPYLYEDELYGQISQDLPRLTVGGLLLRLSRLLALEDQLSPNHQQRLKDARINYEQQRSEWKTYYERKIQQELKARLRNLNAFLDEVGTDVRRIESAYPVEATRRTIIENLKDEAERLDIWERDVEDEYLKVNSRLKRVLNEEADFIWADTFQPVYPADKYWWLYRKPKEEEEDR